MCDGTRIFSGKIHSFSCRAVANAMALLIYKRYGFIITKMNAEFSGASPRARQEFFEAHCLSHYDVPF